MSLQNPLTKLKNLKVNKAPTYFPQNGPRVINNHSLQYFSVIAKPKWCYRTYLFDLERVSVSKALVVVKDLYYRLSYFLLMVITDLSRKTM